MSTVTIKLIRMKNGSKRFVKFMPEDNTHIDNFKKATYIHRTSPLAMAKVIKLTLEIEELIDEEVLDTAEE